MPAYSFGHRWVHAVSGIAPPAPRPLHRIARSDLRDLLASELGAGRTDEILEILARTHAIAASIRSCVEDIAAAERVLAGHRLSDQQWRAAKDEAAASKSELRRHEAIVFPLMRQLDAELRDASQHVRSRVADELPAELFE